MKPVDEVNNQYYPNEMEDTWQYQYSKIVQSLFKRNGKFVEEDNALDFFKS